jgi:hypothetical protein
MARSLAMRNTGGKRGMGRMRSRWGTAICVLGIVMAMLGLGHAEEHSKIPLPSYHYGAKIPVECLNRSM